MPIHVACPRCRKQYSLAANLPEKRVWCPACEAPFTIPAGAVTTAPTASSAPIEPAILEAEPAAKSRTWLYVLLGGGCAALLLLGITAAGLVAAVLLLRSAPQAPVASNGPPNTGQAPQPAPPLPPQENPPPGPKPNPPAAPRPKRPPAPRPARPPEPKAEADDGPVGPRLVADPLPQPLRAPAKPGATLPLPSASETRNDPVRYPRGPAPLAAVLALKKPQSAWEVWDLQAMKHLGSVPGSGGERLFFSSDGAYLAMPSYGRAAVRSSAVEIYSVADGKPLRKHRLGGDAETGFADFAGPGKFLSVQARGRQGQARLWDVKTGEQVGTFQTAAPAYRGSAELSPGGRYLAVFDALDQRHPISVYEVTTGQLVRTLRPRLRPSDFYAGHGLAFSDDGKELAVLLSGSDGADHIQAWDFETGKRTADHAFGTSLQKAAKNAPGFPVPLKWLPNRAGWLAYEKLMIDHDRGTIFWRLAPDEPTGILWVRRFLGPDHVVTVVDKGGGKRQLEILALPKDEIAAARKK